MYCHQKTVIVVLSEKKVNRNCNIGSPREHRYKAMLIKIVAFLYWAGPIAGPDTGAHMLAAAIALLLRRLRFPSRLRGWWKNESSTSMLIDRNPDFCIFATISSSHHCACSVSSAIEIEEFTNNKWRRLLDVKASTMTCTCSEPSSHDNHSCCCMRDRNVNVGVSCPVQI